MLSFEQGGSKPVAQVQIKEVHVRSCPQKRWAWPKMKSDKERSSNGCACNAERACPLHSQVFHQRLTLGAFP
jgi:hypothetical protein